MKTGFTRRRFLTISAAACAAPRLSAAAPITRWRGQALGARAELRLAGLDADEAAPILRAVTAELARIDALFSLMRADSALMRLNRAGHLENPPPELLSLLSLSRAAHELTGGLFDPTVQPLFALHATHAAAGTAPTPDEVAETRTSVGLRHVAFDTGRVRFERPGMGLTLNGIAQGYATDRIAALLAGAGLRDVLVDAGEIRALGDAPGQTGWPVRLAGGERHALRAAAVATSRVTGTMVNPAHGIGHIFDPTGRAGAPRAGAISVLHESAAFADAISTAAVFLDRRRLGELARHGVAFSTEG
ncbi:FAD:protein FMN transferase [Actibacterium sp. MT2.3-13A]|uniref:FAD:protein FMN transferase n=1 Tax=Actibacterium sp. MT2.3-13A TaxID=2828332 RepID=UPI001BA4CC6B|nr:FAD:protein FMN transferase [Actibacterium sp. MT2.3-13A]